MGGATGKSGGSYGGMGDMEIREPNRVYGDYRNPVSRGRVGLRIIREDRVVA